MGPTRHDTAGSESETVLFHDTYGFAEEADGENSTPEVIGENTVVAGGPALINQRKTVAYKQRSGRSKIIPLRRIVKKTDLPKANAD